MKSENPIILITSCGDKSDHVVDMGLEKLLVLLLSLFIFVMQIIYRRLARYVLHLHHHHAS